MAVNFFQKGGFGGRSGAAPSKLGVAFVQKAMNLCDFIFNLEYENIFTHYLSKVAHGYWDGVNNRKNSINFRGKHFSEPQSRPCKNIF